MNKFLSVFFVVLGVSFSIGVNAKKLSPAESREVLLNGGNDRLRV